MSKLYYAALFSALSFSSHTAAEPKAPQANPALEFFKKQEQQAKTCGSNMYNSLDQIFKQATPHLDAFTFRQIIASPNIILDKSLREIYTNCTDPETVSTAFCQIKKEQINEKIQHCDLKDPQIMQNPVCYNFVVAPLIALDIECSNTPNAPTCREFGSAMQETHIILDKFFQCTGDNEQMINKAACHAQKIADGQGNYKVSSTVYELCRPAELDRSF